MKKCSWLVYFLLLSCAISFSLGDVKCKKSSSLAYKCSTSAGMLSPLKLKDIVSPAATELDLSKNKLSLSDGSFSTFKRLQTLNLSYGSLSGVTKNFFKGLASLTTLDLSNNNIATLPLDVFDHLDKLSEVRLQNNKWDCDCEKGLMTLLKTRLSISHGPVPALCYKPVTFKKTRINQDCDINECMEENDCDDMATCKDFPFNYTCTCNTKGFEGTGKECTDIDECAGKNDCSTDGGLCINTHGSYICSCKRGYKGNGKTCEDIDECKSHDCDQGECTNSKGSFTCECHEGYTVNDKQVCVDKDECESNNHTCDAIQHSYCSNVEKFLPSDDGYYCLCETGYRKVGKSCVLEGNMKELIKILAMIIGGFFGILFLIIISTVIFRKWRNRTPKAEKKEENQTVIAPVVGMAPPVDFAYLGMPQPEQEGQEEAEEEWESLKKRTRTKTRTRRTWNESPLAHDIQATYPVHKMTHLVNKTEQHA
ncbi:complement activation, classical pathway [Desmophyllum pertusum]|uniref:Complement activation, classical pathway n=1 Tax=Desmophyllum pertusum TaxID=174260 RepID=A0A9W9ZFC4_9CNID|nr:complement activation, classical pathway [Desmophyllum pertusum]